MKCPKCDGGEWKLASVVYAGGLSSTSTTGAGVGANGGGDFGLGVGIGTARGKHQTELSKLAAPPMKRKSTSKEIHPANKVALWGSAAFIAALYFFGDLSYSQYPIFTGFLFGWGLPVIVLISLFIGWGGPKDPEVDEEYRLALLEYEKKKMCLRCGAFYV